MGKSYYIKTSPLHHGHFEGGRRRGQQYFVVLARLRVGTPGLEGLKWEEGSLHSLNVSLISPLPSSLGKTGLLTRWGKRWNLHRHFHLAMVPGVGEVAENVS